MKKVININFHGRVIPIEETAYDILKRYTESLHRYFAQEEGKDEIIHDIESRIAELFAEQLKKGSACITDAQVESIIQSMGKPEEFDQEESKRSSGSAAYSFTAAEPRGQVCRNAADKVLGGVCSGLAHYFRLDPSFVRVLFAALAFASFGTGVLIYIILWLVLPAALLKPNTRKRLYRNSEDKVIGGVASGLAAYLNVSVTIPRIIFVFPLIVAFFTSIFGGSDIGEIVFSGFGGAFFLAYLILWIVIPEAHTASEKLEMRGEKVDLESIRKGVKSELKDLQGRAGAMGDEFSAKVKNWGEEVKSMGSDLSKAGQAAAGTIPPVAKSAGTRIAEVIGTLFKVFFIFLFGVITFALFAALMALLFTGGGPLTSLKPFLIQGVTDNLLLYASLVLVIVLPVVAFIIWIIRRLTKTRSGSKYLGWTFGGLWTIGLICAVFLAASISKEFRRTATTQEDISLTTPAGGRLQVEVVPAEGKFYNINVFDEDDNEEFPRVSADEQQLLLNTIEIVIEKSADSQFHAYLTKEAKSATATGAEANARKIRFPVRMQDDSTLLLPEGFTINQDTRFRDQRVKVHIEVPVGRQIRLSEETDLYNQMSVYLGNSGRKTWNRNRSYDDMERIVESGRWYIMTEQGTEMVDQPASDENSAPGKSDPKPEKDSTTRQDAVGAASTRKEVEGEMNRSPLINVSRLAPMISVLDLMVRF
jgi:phage shock protein PspC (stress-responsive transcriptional regulator)